MFVYAHIPHTVCINKTTWIFKCVQTWKSKHNHYSNSKWQDQMELSRASQIQYLCVCWINSRTIDDHFVIHEVNLTLVSDCKSKGECSFWLRFCCFWSWIFHLFQFSIPLYHYSVCVTLRLLIRFILNLNKTRMKDKKKYSL